MFKKIIQKKKKVITLYTFVIFAIVSVFYVVISFFIQLNTDNSRKNEIIKTEDRLVETEQLNIAGKMDRLLADTLYMADVMQYFEENYTAEQLQSQWMDFLNRKEIYDQIRYIDVDGNEIVRIDYQNKQAEIVSKEELQNKKDRYYFLESISIEKEQVYISRIDLNVENGEIESPNKPMIRFSTPVFDSKEELQGIVVLNYLANDLLEQIEIISNASMGDVYICNEDGFWIYNGVDHDLEWAFMYENKQDVSFKNQFPEEWTRILEEENGSFITEQGAFSFAKTMQDSLICEGTNDVVLGEGDWYVISYISPDTEEFEVLFQNIGDKIWGAIKRNPIVFILLGILSFIAAVIVLLNKEGQDEIKYFSEYDTMTEVYNRRAGFDKLRTVYKKHENDDVKISICFIDVNGLKEVNDTFGHDDGDELLQTVVQAIKKNIRECDFVSRFGGDEFLIIFEGLDLEEAEKVWDRIASEYDRINQEENRTYLVSTSHGIETLTYGESIDETINRADEKMYEEKRRIKQNIKIIR